MIVQFYQDKNKFCLEFPYNERMVNIAKSIPGAQWSKKMTRWEYPATEYIYRRIRDKFKSNLDEVESALSKPKIFKLSSHKFKTRSYEHQIEAVKFILDRFGIKVIL